jgi:arylsulfatase A-like enzyme
MKRPNILFLMADQFNANCLSLLGSQCRTPNLDLLAEDGILYEQAYCNSPICGPSRASFMSGQYQRTHRICTNDIRTLNYPPPPTLAICLRQTGYETALIGKSHMARLWDIEGFKYTRYSNLADCDDLDNPLSLDYFRYLYDNGLADEWDQGTRIEGQPGADFSPWTSKIPKRHSAENWVGEEAVRFLKNRDTSRPFFLQMSFDRPHDPLSLPYDFPVAYHPDDLTLPASHVDFFDNEFDGKHRYLKERITQGFQGYPYLPRSRHELKEMLAVYYSLISWIDEQIGKVISWLKSNNLYDTTAIVFTADHGDFAGEHGMMFKNAGIYESIHRIPMILRTPSGRKNARIKGMVESVDLAPTLLELAGVEVPARMEGRSMLPDAEGRFKGRNSVLCEWVMRNRYKHKLFALRSETHRLLWCGMDQGCELYDLTKDPCELTNLYDDPDAREIKDRMFEQLLHEVSQYDYLINEYDLETLAETVRGSRWCQISKHGKTYKEVVK